MFRFIIILYIILYFIGYLSMVIFSFDCIFEQILYCGVVVQFCISNYCKQLGLLSYLPRHMKRISFNFL